MNTAWSEEEVDFLRENWGSMTESTISKKLGRSIQGIRAKACKEGLGQWMDSTDSITAYRLYQAMTGKTSGHFSTLRGWYRRGLPLHKTRVNNKAFYTVKLDEFWEWAEKNRAYLDFSRLEKYELGPEPEWVDEQRRKDYYSHPHKKKWTDEEVAVLESMTKAKRYTVREIAERLGRSQESVRAKIYNSGFEIPVKDKAGQYRYWTQEEYEAVAEGIRNCDDWEVIAKRIGRTSYSVAHQVAWVYGTYDRDKVRGMIGNGKWGDGAPPKEQNVKIVPKTEDWQKLMCVYGGRCDRECDSCPDFQRVACE